MRLLHALTHRLADFTDDNAPEYVALSHVSGSDEPTYQDLKAGNAASRRGFRKILGCCRQALRDGYEWVWADSVCIDQTSPAEVSEAVNAMYHIYEDCAVCYVYMADVPRFYFADSQWFERGWTLLELLAPRDVEFYAADWAEIGTKSSLEAQIAGITGIRRDVLRGASPATCSVAERLSWAARRRTAKVEDAAYSLMGLFGVHMPVIYGEGRRAWTRLQELILQTTEDMSLLAWSPNVHADSKRETDMIEAYSGCLAPTLSCFGRPDLATYLPSTAFGFDDADSIMYPDVTALEWRHVQRHVSRSPTSRSSQFSYPPPAITNRGIEMTLLIDPSAGETPRSESAGSTASADDAIECDVLAWLYNDVVISGSLSPEPSSRESSTSNSRRSMMVCVWMTVYRPSRSWSGPLWARRTPGKSPVAVPMIFGSRFQPKKMFLQRISSRPAGAGQWKSTPTPSSDNNPLSSTTSSSPPSPSTHTRSLNIRIIGDMDTTPLRIISHFPPKARLAHPQPAKSIDGSLSDMPAGEFPVVTESGVQVNAAGALKFFLMGADPSSDAQFVVVFGQHASGAGQPFCHVEQTDLPSEAGERPFRRDWSPEGKRRGSSPHSLVTTTTATRRYGDAKSAPVSAENMTDRSFLLLQCGVAVVAMIKKRRDRATGAYTPTLVVACYKDGRKFFESSGREI
ncbi:hypothetical protein TD95_000650 [Thielaviopsis punctulata]|uniref:Heterokaryon incompatibility domain-containing protein n=1 Tax=Thielaviopsis punctulata TaxID=72032 RepID=A0A0F4ZK39_9PEZI|nr:hypothetical protein TD95_000650 [Thielaviopsis punctulata]